MQRREQQQLPPPPPQQQQQQQPHQQQAQQREQPPQLQPQGRIPTSCQRVLNRQQQLVDEFQALQARSRKKMKPEALKAVMKKLVSHRVCHLVLPRWDALLVYLASAATKAFRDSLSPRMRHALQVEVDAFEEVARWVALDFRGATLVHRLHSAGRPHLDFLPPAPPVPPLWM
jgi:hypothetical protein